MEEKLRNIEARTRVTLEYQRALELLQEEADLQLRLREIERELVNLGAAGQMARIDRLRKSLVGLATPVLVG